MFFIYTLNLLSIAIVSIAILSPVHLLESLSGAINIHNPGSHFKNYFYHFKIHLFDVCGILPSCLPCVCITHGGQKKE